MFELNNFFDNKNMKAIDKLGMFTVFEHERDLSVSPDSAVTAYFSSEMNVRRRQVYVTMQDSGCVVQAGAMQWMLGNVDMGSGIKGVGNLLGKMAASAISTICSMVGSTTTATLWMD